MDVPLNDRIPPAQSEPDESTVEENSDAPWNEPAECREAQVAQPLDGARLDKALVAMAPEFSRSHLQSLVESGHVRIDGRVADSNSRKVLEGQRLAVELVPTAESQAFRPEAMALPVLFEDEQLIVINKPAGWVVHPAAGNWQGTLLNGLLAWHAGAAALPRAGIVHRLDKDTSGAMVVGKTLQAVTALQRAMAAREVHRQYLAIAHGRFSPGRASIDSPLARDPRSRMRMAVLGSGKPARTDVELLALAQVEIAGRQESVSALSCTLHTGRTHQIRVHLSSRGHPLLGDLLYGGRPALGMHRQALHATRLSFTHPLGGQALSFEAPLPPDFAQAWDAVTGI